MVFSQFAAGSDRSLGGRTPGIDERSHFSSYDRWNPDVLYASIVSLMDGWPILTFKFRGRETSRQLFGGSIDKGD